MKRHWLLQLSTVSRLLLLSLALVVVVVTGNTTTTTTTTNANTTNANANTTTTIANHPPFGGTCFYRTSLTTGSGAFPVILDYLSAWRELPNNRTLNGVEHFMQAVLSSGPNRSLDVAFCEYTANVSSSSSTSTTLLQAFQICNTTNTPTTLCVTGALYHGQECQSAAVCGFAPSSSSSSSPPAFSVQCHDLNPAFSSCQLTCASATNERWQQWAEQGMFTCAASSLSSLSSLPPISSSSSLPPISSSVTVHPYVTSTFPTSAPSSGFTSPPTSVHSNNNNQYAALIQNITKSANNRSPNGDLRAPMTTLTPTTLTASPLPVSAATGTTSFAAATAATSGSARAAVTIAWLVAMATSLVVVVVG